MGDTPVSTGSPYVSRLPPGVQIQLQGHTPGDSGDRPEAGARTALVPILQAAVFDAIPTFRVAQLAPGIYTPALAGLCPWPGWLPCHRARSRDQLPAANIVLCPVPAVLPPQNPCHTRHLRAAGTG